MIRLFLGNVGSGKTACYVREMYKNPTHRKTYSNIVTRNIDNNVQITSDMLVKKEVAGYKKKKGQDEPSPVYEKKFNKEFWMDVTKKEKCINVTLDEAHTLMDARRSMSTRNKIMGDYMAMLRRILGSSPSGYGTLTLITQLDRRIDVIAREMSTQVRFHRCHYNKLCQSCGAFWKESNDDPEPAYSCLSCGSPDIKMCNHVIEVWHFKNIDAYDQWLNWGQKTFHLHYVVRDIHKYFKFYDTLQWDNLFTED